MGVLEFICDSRFHQSFVLPADPEAGRQKPYRTTYADFGDIESSAVVLFCGALFGSRLCYSPLDQLAKTYHVRIIHPDRPGVGGSDAVEPDKRIQTWLEMVPKLLAHLNISHVSVASHSGGDIYLMNLILTHPHLLHPEKPYVCFFAPWTHYSHSKVATMLATELLPASMIGKFGSVGRFVNNNVVPLVGLSGSFVHGVSGPFLRTGTASASEPSTDSEEPSNSNSSDIRLDDPRVVEELREYIMNYMYAESVDGVSQDARLFLKRSGPWNAPNVDWNDFDDAVQLLSRKLCQSNQEYGIWAIDCFHAEHDQLVGEKGKAWFDSIWVPSQGYLYQSEQVKGTEHNFLMDPAFGASEKWLQRVSAAWKASDSQVGALQ